MIATWDEWLLLVVTFCCLSRVVLLVRRAHYTQVWSRTITGLIETTARQRGLIRDHYSQERTRLWVSMLYCSAGVMGVLNAPPPPDMSFQARWKLWVIISASLLLWYQSERAWKMLERRAHMVKEQNGSAVVSTASPVSQ